jgi:hypothetical protein
MSTSINLGMDLPITHQVKINYFMTFKILRGDVFKVTIFDYTMTGHAWS